VVHHAGDWNAFLTGRLQSLCAACHAEKHGRLKVPIGPDGWPRQANAAPAGAGGSRVPPGVHKKHKMELITMIIIGREIPKAMSSFWVSIAVSRDGLLSDLAV